MIELTERTHGTTEAALQLVLPFDIRQKSRFRARLNDGREVFVSLDRGSVLRDGDTLRSTTGETVVIRSAPEEVSVGHTPEPLLLARACYHLGNRHVPLQIAGNELIYQHDHVLDDMLRSQGLSVFFAQRPFEPESGAYGDSHGHHHAHHSHSHDHTH